MTTPERTKHNYELGFTRDPETNEMVPRVVEMWEPSEPQLATLMRVGNWLLDSEDMADREAAGMLVIDAVNLYLAVLEALFVDRREMVRAVHACASGNEDLYRQYTELASEIVKGAGVVAEEPAPRNGPRPTKRAPARRR